MKKFLFVALLSLPFLAQAQDAQPRHLISIGTDGFGWSGFSQVFDWDKDESGIKDHKTSKAEFKLNYSYIFESRVMLGAFIISESEESELKGTNGNKVRTESSSGELGLSLGYSFNEDLYSSWWIQAALSAGKAREITKDSNGKETFDYGLSAFYLSAGKRFSLEGWGLKYVSYSPSVTLASAKITGDAKDEGLDRAAQVRIDLIKIDILF